MTPQEFIDQLAPAARQSMLATGVYASFAVAEAALESGWGSSQLASQGFNLFGVKADPSWTGDVLTLNTREYLNNAWVLVPARWRRYPDWAGSLVDHAAFLTQNPRYHAAFEAADGEAFARAVAAAGYATDPDYAEKVIATMRSHNLAALDT